MIKKPRRKQNYINNKTLYEHMKLYHAELKECQARGEPRPVLPRYIAECIILIANKLATKRSFSKYSYKEEMILDSIENCVQYVHNFNPEKSSYPFAYITRMVRNAFLRRIDSEHKQQYAMLANSQRHLILDQLNPHEVMGETVELYDNLLDFMEDFEKKNNLKMSKKKEKRRNKSEEKMIDEFWAS